MTTKYYARQTWGIVYCGLKNDDLWMIKDYGGYCDAYRGDVSITHIPKQIAIVLFRRVKD